MTRLFTRTAVVIVVVTITLLAGCRSAADRQGNSESLSIHDTWALQALNNDTDAVSAAVAASALLETHLHRRQLLRVINPVSQPRYTVSGVLTQWHYVGNVSPRPVVALRLSVTDNQLGELVWSGAIENKGKRRQTLSALADHLLETLTNQIPLTDRQRSPAEQMALASAQALAINSSSSATGLLAGGLGMRKAADYGLDRTVQTPEPLQGRSTAFYYAPNPPVDVLSQFDRLVLEPDNIKKAELHALSARGTRTYAYLSVGEVGPQRAYASAMKKQWILGKNPAWNSSVLDLASDDLRRFLLDRVGRLQAAGYRGLFLDTMDSFNLVAKTELDRLAQRTGLVTLINDIAREYPGMLMISNRGFEVLDDIAPHIEAVAAESLYASWNNTTQQYTQVPDGDRQWLMGKLLHARNELNLDVISIDYLPPERRAEARSVAARIATHGFIPWVANPELDYVGIGALEVLPRKVLMLFNSTLDGALQKSPVHKFVATPVEYMGYVPEYLDIATQALPVGELKGRYAGIVMWTGKTYKQPSLRPWLQQQLNNKVPLVLLGTPPVAPDATMLASMGIALSESLDMESATLSHSDDYIKPERSLSPRIDSMGLTAVSVDPDNAVHMSYQDSKTVQSDVVVTGAFGGFAWQPGLVDDGLDYETYWVVDPFRFLRTALQLPDAPMPDVTTENGKRLWLAHIDGDALPSWAEMPGKQLGAEVIYDRILAPYQLPHTISIVEGEMTDPKFEDRRHRMFDIAKKTFELDFVELASHTYSHPFNWAELAAYGKSGRYNLPVEGYEYSAERESAGSIDFIDTQLAPTGKRTELMLWSGDALPNVEDLAVLDRLGIPNMNGGITNATNASRSMTMISPMARPVENYLQVYAPIMNENMYTNDWTGPFDGFHRVIETFKLTDMPRRLKPLNIYYHFYSGTKIAAIKALMRVYDWTLEQDIHPVFGSEYAVKVPDYRQAGVARYLDGPWKFSALGNVRSLRLLSNDRWPDMSSSQGIAGARSLHDGVYLHTDGSDQVLFKTQSTKPAQIHLVSSNGQVLQWDDKGQGLSFRITGHVPVVVELGGKIAGACTLETGGKLVRGVVSAKNTLMFTFTSKDTGNASLNCPA